MKNSPHLFLLPLIIFVLFSYVSCSKKGSNNTPTPNLSVNQSAFTIEANSGSKDTFVIVSNTAWTAKSDQTWLSLSPSMGNGNAHIIATAMVNSGSPASRKATITISASSTSDQLITITQDAGILIVAGNGTSGATLQQLALPYGIFVDANENLYVTEAVNNRVTKWASSSTQGIIVAGNGDKGANLNHLNQLNSPTGVSVDSVGNLYVSDFYNLRATKWAPGASQGVIVALTDTEAISNSNFIAGPSAIFLDRSGNIFMSEQDNEKVCEWMPGVLQGVTVAGTGTYGAALNELSDPEGIYIDTEENLYIADASNHRVMKWTPGAIDGIIVAGNGSVGNALNQLQNPYSVFFDKVGNMYVSDFDNNRIMRFAPGNLQGTIAAGTGLQGNALNELYNPTGIFIDSKGYLYVSDTGNNRVVRWAQ